jgi:hypothetical protein
MEMLEVDVLEVDEGKIVEENLQYINQTSEGPS